MIPDKDLYDITVLAVGINGNTYVASDSDRLIIDTNEVLNSSFTKKALDNKILFYINT